MAKRKKRTNHGGGPIDQISNLPTHVTCNILQCLPFRDVVRTSILSRGWRHLWASVPRLDFGDEFFKDCKHDATRVITEVLLLHNGPVHEFSLTYPYNHAIRELNKWILFLTRSGIRHLQLLLNTLNDPHQMPSYFFSCQELAYLELQDFKLSLPPNFCGFKSLTELHLFYVTFVSNEIGTLISSCPLLDTLSVELCSGYEYIDICAPSLKVLYINEGGDIKSIRLHNANNLIQLDIVGNNSGQNFEKEKIPNLIKSFLNLECLSIGASYFKIFSTSIPQVVSSALNSLTFMALEGVNFNEPEELFSAICLLKNSLHLKELSMTVTSSAIAMAPVPECLEELKRNWCSFSKLRTVNITVETYHKLVLELIRYLLAHSSSLDTLTFKFLPRQNQPGTSKMLSIAQDVLKMERVSPKAQVEFLYDGPSE